MFFPAMTEACIVLNQIYTDEQLRVLGDPSGNSFAIGDCADIKGRPLPCTAQVSLP